MRILVLLPSMGRLSFQLNSLHCWRLNRDQKMLGLSCMRSMHFRCKSKPAAVTSPNVTMTLRLLHPRAVVHILSQPTECEWCRKEGCTLLQPDQDYHKKIVVVNMDLSFSKESYRGNRRLQLRNLRMREHARTREHMRTRVHIKTSQTPNLIK